MIYLSFFLFIKQELNVSHLVSLSKNGKEVMVYMTLIIPMLVLVYKKANNFGYKTAKRISVIKLTELIMGIMITLSGRDPSKGYKTLIGRNFFRPLLRPKTFFFLYSSLIHKTLIFESITIFKSC